MDNAAICQNPESNDKFDQALNAFSVQLDVCQRAVKHFAQIDTGDIERTVRIGDETESGFDHFAEIETVELRVDIAVECGIHDLITVQLLKREPEKHLAFGFQFHSNSYFTVVCLGFGVKVVDYHLQNGAYIFRVGISVTGGWRRRGGVIIVVASNEQNTTHQGNHQDRDDYEKKLFLHNFAPCNNKFSSR